MHGLAVLALVVVAVGAGVSDAADVRASRTALTVTYWPHGLGSSSRATWTLACSPPRGTLRRPRRACRKLAAGGRALFAPVPRNAVCSQIYGGPAVARVVGRLDGRKLRTTFSRRDGCQIARWARVSPWLLPRSATP
jgi:hypothetical protein